MENYWSLITRELELETIGNMEYRNYREQGIIGTGSKEIIWTREDRNYGD